MIPLVTTFSSTSLKLNSIVKTHFEKLKDMKEPLSDFKGISTFMQNLNLKDFLVHVSQKHARTQQNETF